MLRSGGIGLLVVLFGLGMAGRDNRQHDALSIPRHMLLAAAESCPSRAKV